MIGKTPGDCASGLWPFHARACDLGQPVRQIQRLVRVTRDQPGTHTIARALIETAEMTLGVVLRGLADADRAMVFFVKGVMQRTLPSMRFTMRDVVGKLLPVSSANAWIVSPPRRHSAGRVTHRARAGSCHCSMCWHIAVAAFSHDFGGLTSDSGGWPGVWVAMQAYSM